MSKKIDELVEYFNEIILPDGPIKHNESDTIIHPGKFVTGHLAILKANAGNKTFKPYYDRLEKFYLFLKSNYYA